METINLTAIIEAAIALIVAVVSAFVIPWVKKKVGAEDMTDFLRWVDIGVAAAEQIFTSVATQEKKDFVLQFLWEKGFSYNELEVDAAIEAAVIKLHTELYGQTEKGGEVNAEK